MMAALLPQSSLVGVATRRLAHADVAWHDGAGHAAIDPATMFCCPQPYEAEHLYGRDTRIEWADRYGGAGVGAAGGSGRCTTHGGLQTKGTGVTPLVAPHADRLHSSGTLILFEAATEALFAGVYGACLPFGAVPVHAVVLTGGRFVQPLGDDAAAPCVRSLAVRPFVARPAHFMRNLLNPDGLRAAGPEAPGLTADAWRTTQALALLASNFQASLGLPGGEHDEAALLDAGFRELARRLAWQCAAGFAKRLPHGTLSCSNMALNGAYLDFGVSSFTPAYRRLCWAHGQEPWTESLWPARTLLALRQQLDKYRPEVRDRGVIGGGELADEYGKHLQQRLAIEMAKMAGLTEDMAAACPADLLAPWLKAMRAIWTRGAHERFVTDAGRLADGRPAPPPRRTGSFDLNAILAAAGPCADADSMDRTLVPLLNDAALRREFVGASVRVRAWLGARTGVAAGPALAAYLGRQARRKNATLPALQREKRAGLDLLTTFRQLEIQGDIGAIGPAIDRALGEARHVLADLDPALPGDTGIAQWLAVHETLTEPSLRSA